MIPISEMVVHKDNQLIAFNKPAGMIVHAQESEDKTLEQLASIYTKGFVKAIHRIDRPTSGLVLFAKSQKTLSALSKDFQDRKIKKVYYALVEKKEIPLEGTLENFLKHSTKNNKSYITTEEEGKHASLKYEVVGSTDKYHILKVLPITGRTHQIRAQLSNIGFPIKGDVKYGARRAEKDKSIFLHAAEMQLVHPTSKEDILIKAPFPSSKLWQIVESILKDNPKG